MKAVAAFVPLRSFAAFSYTPATSLPYADSIYQRQTQAAQSLLVRACDGPVSVQTV